ncbi:hypothetical protein GIB67_014941 [Kingdonia uniflora]|uniref:BED-type domain-containing protein n=1 Tax=Kingdonia uniflora TaxID=39325 RepID=A0A7J7MTJ6_9MAGN|nr:hypothetical protein GIB67_014941 [Kingdonia uniflora]
MNFDSIEADSSIESPIQMSFIDNNEPGTSESQPNKHRRKKSIVWEHFTVEDVGDGCSRACCNQCKQTFAYSNGTKLSGTSHLKRHIAFGTCLGNRRRERNELTRYTGNSTDPPRKRNRVSSVSSNFPFDETPCREEIAKMIIMHDYPLDMVEHPSFVSFAQMLQPRFNMINSETVRRDCHEIYEREKLELAKILEGNQGRINLSIDMWTSSQTLGYVILTGHFINNNWKLQRRVFNVVRVPSPHNVDALSYAVGFCLGKWGLASKVFTLSSNKLFLNNSTGGFMDHLSFQNSRLLIGHCYAQTLSNIAQESLVRMRKPIEKIRDSVKYIEMSQVRKETFLQLKQKLQVPSARILSLDDKTKWNSTYFMLAAAVELKEVFVYLDSVDPEYILAPSTDDWNQIAKLSLYLRLLYDAVNALSGSLFLTANFYFEEVLKILCELNAAITNPDPIISNLTMSMKEKFDTYWNDCSFILAVAVVMDPRSKMKVVQEQFWKIYGDDANAYLTDVDSGLRELFTEYMQTPLQIYSLDEPLFASDKFSDFDVYLSETPSYQQTKSELDQYLEEPLLPNTQELDILDWWKLHSMRYPTLSRMARDILAIPVSTVAPEYAFNTGDNELDHYKSSLQAATLEALVCAKDWLRYEPTPTLNTFVKMEISLM